MEAYKSRILSRGAIVTGVSSASTFIVTYLYQASQSMTSRQGGFTQISNFLENIPVFGDFWQTHSYDVLSNAMKNANTYTEMLAVRDQLILEQSAVLTVMVTTALLAYYGIKYRRISKKNKSHGNENASDKDYHKAQETPTVVLGNRH